MRQTHLFTKTRREAPSGEVAKNASLLIRGGFIHKEMAGVYSYLPLGLRVLKNIEKVIREEMNAMGGQEVFLTTLQNPEIWKASGRWDDSKVDNWFKTKLKNGEEVGIANTHEEPLTLLLREHIQSYKDLPKYIYQFQNKFRNELRAKSGIMRGREFLMKDMYSFSGSEKEFEEFYDRVAEAYMKIFTRVGLGEVTYRTTASGGSFTNGLTDEFQTVSEAGEDTIYIDDNKHVAVNKEVLTDDTLKKLDLKKENLREAKSIEVGNIFPLDTGYAGAMGLVYKDREGKKQFPIMGSYGIGLSRLIGTVVEVLSDERGIVWPKEIAPFSIHIIAIGLEDDSVRGATDALYDKLCSLNVPVLYDDRDVGAGEKFSDSDLLGIPTRVVVSNKTLALGKLEVTKRDRGEQEAIVEEEFIRSQTQ
jgi:prolyl-tRNA synthetase